MARGTVGVILALTLAVALLLPPHHSLAPPGMISGARAATLRLPHRWPAPAPTWSDLWLLRDGSGGTVANTGASGSATLAYSGSIDATGLDPGASGWARIAASSLTMGAGDYSVVVVVRLDALERGGNGSIRFIDGWPSGTYAYVGGVASDGSLRVVVTQEPASVGITAAPALPRHVAVVISRTAGVGSYRWIWDGAAQSSGAALQIFGGDVYFGNNGTGTRPLVGRVIAVGTVAAALTDAEAVVAVAEVLP
jgi:hypothetical protein